MSDAIDLGPAQDLLNAPTHAVVTTVGPNGQPQASVVWVISDGSTVRFSTLAGRQKARNLAANPRVTLLAYEPGNPYRYVEVRGTASVTPDPDGALIEALSQAYTGDAWQAPGPEERVVVTISPEHVVLR